MRDSAEQVKEALQEARKAQAAASGAIQQASADLQSTTNLLSSVSTGPNLPAVVRTGVHGLVCAAFRWSGRGRRRS